MVYSVMVFAARAPGVTHEYFKSRYERHMGMIAEMCGSDAAPVRHTRWYPKHDTNDKPVLLAAGDPADTSYDAIVLMEFVDEAAFGRFTAALVTEEANARIMADEAGFWDRNKMKVVPIGDVKVWEP